MTQVAIRTRHERELSPQSLLGEKIGTYADLVADSSNIRRFRLDKGTWDDYGDLVGDAGRSADIQAYIEWRLDNPDTPLPGKRRGPVKRTRPQPSKPKAENADD